MKICYFAIKDLHYPRQRRISAFFEEQNGATVTKVAIDPSQGFRRNGVLLAKFVFKTKQRYDAVILAEFSLQFAFLALVLARKSSAVLIVDWFVGLYETRVEDYGHHKRLSPKALAYHWVDRFAARRADLLITDTRPRALMLKQRFGLCAEPLTVAVGAPGWARYVHHETDPNCLNVLYYGNYIPLHGLEVVVRGVIEASERINVRMTLIGEGPDLDRVRKLVDSASDPALFTFLPSIQEHLLIDHITTHDVVVGVFGASPKARSVVANKVWQGLASGKRVLTQTSHALDPLRSSFEGLLYECSPDPASITLALVDIARKSGPSIEDRLEAANVVANIVNSELLVVSEAITGFEEAKSNYN